MDQEKRWISSEVLFAAISEQLVGGRQAVFTVTGMSMWPLICHGRDQVIVERVQSVELQLGDIVLYRISEGHYILHRVTDLRDKTFQTTGDGNFFRDPFVSYNCLIAKVSTVIRDGKAIPCNSWKWKQIFRLWMALFPVRKPLFQIWFFLRKWIKHD